MRPLLRQPCIELPVHVQDPGVQHRLWQLQACLHMRATCVADHPEKGGRHIFERRDKEQVGINKFTIRIFEQMSNTACQTACV